MSNLNNRIILGTAQFGLEYGINNKNGKVPKNKIFEILDYAYSNGIYELDTASSYGDSEIILGEYLLNNPNKEFIISTKISKSNLALEDQVLKSIDHLNVKKINKLLFHSYDLYKYFENELSRFYNKFKNILFDEIGVSIYTNNEIKSILNDNIIKRIQSPYNLLDNYKLRGDIFKEVIKSNKKLDVRSVFLQGLFFKKIKNLPLKMYPLKKQLNEINKIITESNFDITSISLGYVKSFDFIDKILIGIDSLEQLKINLKSFSNKIPRDLCEKISLLSVEDNDLINPSKW